MSALLAPAQAGTSARPAAITAPASPAAPKEAPAFARATER